MRFEVCIPMIGSTDLFVIARCTEPQAAGAIVAALLASGDESIAAITVRIIRVF